VDIWTPLTAIGTIAAAGIAAGATFVAKAAADRSNRAATTLAEIENQRRHRELCPRLRIFCEPFGTGVDGYLRLRATLVGPPGLDRLDRLTATIRDDHFRRADSYHEREGGPTVDEIRAHIWGPYRFTPRTGPYSDTLADRTGRTTVFDVPIPAGEQLVYQLEHTTPGRWMEGLSPANWIKDQGTLIRMAFTAEHDERGTWYLPCEIETAELPVTVYLPQWTPAVPIG
jgi:hypothetical protein